eukprot:m.32466 g.32466  ORF g.32466 m.32466 type:complete len:143 (-) comp12153_c0_seq2:548-976(-)
MGAGILFRLVRIGTFHFHEEPHCDLTVQVVFAIDRDQVDVNNLWSLCVFQVSPLHFLLLKLGFQALPTGQAKRSSLNLYSKWTTAKQARSRDVQNNMTTKDTSHDPAPRIHSLIQPQTVPNSLKHHDECLQQEAYRCALVRC